MTDVPSLVRRATLAVILLAAIGVHAQGPSVVYLAVDLASGRTLEASREDLLDTPIALGSVAKIATLAAALESGVIRPSTAILCTRKAVVAGQTLTCSHPDLYRPLTAIEALAHSCNVYFATIAGRLSRASLDAALGPLGLMPSHAGRPIAGAALGVDGLRASPRQLVGMMGRVSMEPSTLPWKAETLRVIREGLRGAARYGTASVFEEHRVSALAKTGTTVSANGVRGLVVGVVPSSRPTVGFVLVAAGASGADAAALAVDRLASVVPRQGASVRIGTAQADGRYSVRTMPVDDYVAAVVAGESGPAGPSALEALAITARTFALANRRRHAAEGFDLCDLTHCQVLRRSTDATRRAATATADKVLMDRGAPADVYYSASCGGHTSAPSTAWPGAPDRPFLPARLDDAHGGEPTWSSDLSATNLARTLRAGGFKGDGLRDLAAVERDTGGRVTWLRVDGFTPDRISGADLRTLVGRTLGWQHLKSTLFEVRRSGAGYRFTGRGAGHGVGLCVLGSTRLAAQGQSAEAILGRYFPGLQVGSVREPATASRPTRSSLRLLLPEADAAEQQAVRAFALRARDELSAELQVGLPPAITLRFHATVEAYQRATGQPWFTAGATTRDQAQFIPVSILRKRGLLERSVRHELVHVLTGDALGDKPRWVIEGVAAHYAEGPPPDRVDRAVFPVDAWRPLRCPADSEFTGAASQDSLRDAYARARRCVADQLARGRTWRDVH